MNKNTCKRTSIEPQVERPGIQGTRPVVSRQSVARGRRGGRISGQGPVRTVIFSDSMFTRLSKDMVEEDRNAASAEEEGITSTETEHLVVMPS